MHTGPPLEVKIWGDWACFTRPEMKVERVTYPVITPSAARGVLEAIFWKPEFTYHIREIVILNPIRFYSIKRNEVSQIAVISTVKGWAEDGEGGYFSDEDRQQRHTLALRDVAYIIKADVALKRHATDPEPKYRDQFRRRIARGQCYHHPYLGCREFEAHFSEPVGNEVPYDYSAELGLMLFDMDYVQDGSGRGTPRFFDAKVNKGVMQVPQDSYEKEVR